jgi:hypothetical protein
MSASGNTWRTASSVVVVSCRWRVVSCLCRVCVVICECVWQFFVSCLPQNSTGSHVARRFTTCSACYVTIVSAARLQERTVTATSSRIQASTFAVQMKIWQQSCIFPSELGRAAPNAGGTIKLRRCSRQLSVVCQHGHIPNICITTEVTVPYV